MIKELVYPSPGPVYMNAEKRVYWGAIFAGTAFALALLLCLSLLGGGIGLVTMNPGGGGAKGLSIGAGIWWFVCSILSFYGGGWMAGRLTGIARVSESVIHGLVTWSFINVALALLLTTAFGKALGAVSGTIGNVLSAGIVPAASGATAPSAAQVATATAAAGGASLFAFVTMIAEALSAAYGARHGTRVLRPVSGIGEIRREHSVR